MRENGLEIECAGIGKPLEKKDSELDKLTFKYEKALINLETVYSRVNLKTICRDEHDKIFEDMWQENQKGEKS